MSNYLYEDTIASAGQMNVAGIDIMQGLADQIYRESTLAPDELYHLAHNTITDLATVGFKWYSNITGLGYTSSILELIKYAFEHDVKTNNANIIILVSVDGNHWSPALKPRHTLPIILKEGKLR